MFCRQCGAQIADNATFCRKCGHQTAQAATPDQSATQYGGQVAMQYGRQAAAQVQPAVMQQVTDFFNAFAADAPGEFGTGMFDDGIGNIANLARQGMAQARGIASAAGGTNADRKGKFHVAPALISAFAMAILWVVQLVWMRNGTENIGTTLLNWLTFAKGGVDRGVIGTIGGLLGKGAVATAVAGICGGGFRTLGAGFKRAFSGANFRKNTIGFMLMGIGIALIFYQLFTGEEGSFAGAMAAVSGMLVTCRSLGGGAGMIFSMVRGLTARKKPNGAKVASAGTKAMLGGLTMGFSLAAAISVLSLTWAHLILGGNLFTVGLILALAMGKSGTQVI